MDKKKRLLKNGTSNLRTRKTRKKSLKKVIKDLIPYIKQSQNDPKRKKPCCNLFSMHKAKSGSITFIPYYLNLMVCHAPLWSRCRDAGTAPPPQCVELKLRWRFCVHGSKCPEIY